jgi:ATP-dependent NAD(P)H-hydrate dehydratase
MKSFVGFSFNFLEGVEASFAQSVRSIIPPLSYSNHKGIMGRIAVLGGSRDYTGAPYYAANGALKFGADLSFVYCSAEAATPIKCYSPELMVSPFYKDEVLLNENSVPEKRTEIEKAASIVTSGLSRAHTLIVGPGLGRNPAVHEATSIIIHFARNNNIPLIVDADGLWLVTQNLNLLRGYSRCILTPNKAEFGRLLEAAIHEISEINSRQSNEITSLLLSELQSSQDEIQIRALSLTLGGVTILRKGEIDIICNGDSVYKLGIRGSPRRCGGQGDILSGCLGVSFYWANKVISSLPVTQ